MVIDLRFVVGLHHQRNHIDSLVLLSIVEFQTTVAALLAALSHAAWLTGLVVGSMGTIRKWTYYASDTP
eukprot:SAG31_NODE_441_length_15661_cov_17.905423_7_plen_69_part_00